VTDFKSNKPRRIRRGFSDGFYRIYEYNQNNRILFCFNISNYILNFNIHKPFFLLTAFCFLWQNILKSIACMVKKPFNGQPPTRY